MPFFDYLLCFALDAGCDSDYASSEVRTRRSATERDRYLPGSGDMYIRVGLREVVGPTGVVSAERAVSVGDEISGAEHCGVREYDFHGVDCAVLSCCAVSPEIRDILAVRGVDCDNELLHLLPVAGDEAGPD